MLTFYKKYSRTVFDIGLIVLTVYLIMLVFSFIYKIAAPIILAFVIFWIIEPLAKRLHRAGLKKSIATAISVLLFILLLLGAIAGAGIIFTAQITALAARLPAYADIMKEQIPGIIDYFQNKVAALPPDLHITDKAKEWIGGIASKGSEYAKYFLLYLIGLLSSISTFVVNFSVAIILAYFLSVEIGDWKRIASDKTPRTFKIAFTFLRENVLKGIGSYIKSQFKLIGVTFVIIFISLLVLGVNNAFSISLLAAFFDLLPLLGVSTVFIPWIIYLFIVGDTTLAIWLTVLLGAVILFRQILEPKITGDSLGVSAFTMLSFMIISLSIFGVAGLIMSPILIILLKALYDQGYLKRWIHLPAEEYDHVK